MNIKYLPYVIVAVVSGLGSFYITKSFFPRIETKEVQVEKEIVRTDVKTITKVIERPDGTKETVQEVIDKSVSQETKVKESVVVKKDKWKADLGVRAKVSDIQNPVYDLTISRRILETPFFGGIKISTDKSIGLNIGIEF